MDEDHARRLIERFGLRPHPEGGHYREIYRAPLEVRHPGVPAGTDERRAACTAIYFLLRAGEFSAFHRVRHTDELWHLYAGGDLELHLIHADGRYEPRVLTADLERGEPATLVEAGCWQAARPAREAGFSFCGCTVAPGFSFAELDLPACAQLLRAYPEYAAIIGELGRRDSQSPTSTPNEMNLPRREEPE